MFDFVKDLVQSKEQALTNNSQYCKCLESRTG